MRSAEKHKAASQGQQTIQSWSLYKRLGEWDDVIVGPDTGQSDEEGGAGTRVVEIGELADALAEVRRLRKALENIFPIVDRMAHRGRANPRRVRDLDAHARGPQVLSFFSRSAERGTGMRPDPAFSMISDDEARALRLAVRYAIRQGLATDGGDGLPLTNDSLLSVARKLGMDVGGDAA